MRPASLAFLIIPLCSLLALAGGCGKKKTDTDEDNPKDTFVSAKVQGGGAGAAREPLKAPLDGTITGRVVFKGEKPKEAIIGPMAAHTDHAVCLAGKEFEKIDQKWIIGEGDGVANVVVFLKAPAGKYFAVSEDAKKEAAAKKVVIDQPHCAFIPHVAAVFAGYWDGGKEPKLSGETFAVKNSAPINHNTKWAGDPRKTGEGNVTLKTNDELAIKLVPETNPIQLECSIHPWMGARVWAFDHPYFAVTKSDGRFEIKNVPTGVEVGVVAWHEAAGFFHEGKEGVKQKLSAGENKVDLSISAK